MGRKSNAQIKKEKRVAYITKYIKKNYKCVAFKFNREKEADLISFLEAKGNVQGYIKQLIREDMEKSSQE